MSQMVLKTELTLQEKVLTMAGITGFGVCLSSWIGRNFLSQAILASFILTCLRGGGPTVVYAFVRKFKRDML